MGSGIAISLATGGIAVTLVDAEARGARRRARRASSPRSPPPQRKGRLSAEAAAAAAARLQGSVDARRRRGADLVIEAVFENLAVKHEVFARLGALCRAGRGARDQYLDARHRRDRRGDADGRPTSSACTSSARRTSCGWSRSCAGAQPPREALATAHGGHASASARSACRSATASASSATACSTPTAARRN